MTSENPMFSDIFRSYRKEQWPIKWVKNAQATKCNRQVFYSNERNYYYIQRRNPIIYVRWSFLRK